MRAALVVAAAAFALAGCAGAGNHRARLAAHADLSALQTSLIAVRNGASGAPVNGLLVSGTITNTGPAMLRCRLSAFLLIEENGNAVAPSSQWCDVPAIAPTRSARFSATFPQPAQLRVECGFCILTAATKRMR